MGRLAFLCAALLAPCVASALPAFPGAEGFGSETPGGRAGAVLQVTTLADSGPGSLREALTTPGPRIVVFRVGGTILLEEMIRVRHPYLTIAGQTAPGDGITIRNGSHRSTPLRVETHDVVIRHLRIRPGPGGGPDGLSIGRGRNIVVDHCSLSWAVDENLAVTGNSRDVTVQWSVIAEGLHDSTHPKGPHSMGDLIGSRGDVSLHHNLYAHNDARNPRIGGGPKTVDFVNNVIYNFGSMAGRLSARRLVRVNYVGNVVRPGPSSHPDAVALGMPNPYPVEVFARDNVLPRRGLVDDDFEGTLVKARHPAPPVTTSPAQDAYEAVLRSAGATRPRRDAIDARIVASVRERSGRVIDHPEDVGGWISARGGTAPADRDGDGMPDAWEVRHGFDPDDPSDGSKDADGDGYTNVEEFLNGTHPRKRTPGR